MANDSLGSCYAQVMLRHAGWAELLLFIVGPVDKLDFEYVRDMEYKSNMEKR